MGEPIIVEPLDNVKESQNSYMSTEQPQVQIDTDNITSTELCENVNESSSVAMNEMVAQPWDEFIASTNMFNGNFFSDIATNAQKVKSSSENLDSINNRLGLLGAEFENYEQEMVQTRFSFCTRLQNVSSFLSGGNNTTSSPDQSLSTTQP